MAGRPILPVQAPRAAYACFAMIAGLPWLAVLIAMLVAFQAQLRPEALRRLQAVGHTVTVPTEHALDLGIPLAGLRGMDAFLDQVLAENPFLQSLAVTAGPGQAGAGPWQRGPDAGGGAFTTLPIRRGDQVVATLRIVQKAGVEEPAYQSALRDLLLGLLVALVAGFQIVRCLLAVLVTEELRLAEAVIAAVAGGRLTQLAGGAAVGGEIGALLSAANRLMRRAADRMEDVMIYGREVRAVSGDATAQAAIDGMLANLQRRIRLSLPLAIRDRSGQESALHRFAVFLAAVALMLQLPSMGLWGQASGAGTAGVLVNMIVAALAPGRAWTGLAVLLGRRGAALVALFLAVLPVVLGGLLPPAGAGAQVPLLSLLLPLSAVLGLSGLLRQGASGDPGSGVVRLAMPGAACGCGLLALIYQPAVLGGLAVGLAVVTFLLLLPARREVSGAAQRRASLPAVTVSLARAPRPVAAAVAVLLTFLALFSLAAAALPPGLSGDAAAEWSTLAAFAAAATIGSTAAARAVFAPPARTSLGWLRQAAPFVSGGVLLVLLCVAIGPDTLVPVALGAVSGAAAVLAQAVLAKVARARRDIDPVVAGRWLGGLGAAAGLLAGAAWPSLAQPWLGAVPLGLGLMLAVLARSLGRTGQPIATRR